MNLRRLFLRCLSITTLFMGPSLRLSAADLASKSGYTVVLEIKRNEKGVAEDVRVVTSDDTTIDHVLEMTAVEKARQMKPEPRMTDGHPVSYSVRAPFVFPVEGDEGPESNLAPKPVLQHKIQAQPGYPPELSAKGIVGGAILELIIRADGSERDVMLLRASHPEFGESAMAAVKQWQFNPAVVNGVPVSSRWRVAIVFQTDVRVPGWEWRLAPRPSLGSYTVTHRTLPLPPPPPPEAAVPATQPPAAGPAK